MLDAITIILQSISFDLAISSNCDYFNVIDLGKFKIQSSYNCIKFLTLINYYLILYKTKI